jgi:hypothetical protein
MADDDIRIPRSALTGMVALLALSLLGFAFLLGRQSAPAAPPAAPAPPVLAAPKQEAPPSQPLQVGAVPVAPAPPAVYVPPPVAAPPPPPPAVPPAAPLPPPPPPVPVAVAPVAPAPVPAPAAPTGPSPAVKAYFAKIDKIMAGTQDIGDQNAFATQLLQQSMNGKTEGFDSLIASTRKTAQALRSITPPPNCREHYHLLLRQTDKSLSLLEKVKKATVNMDTNELTALGAEGQGMQVEANRLKQLDEQLRSGR